MDEQNQNEIKRLKELYPIHFHVLQNDIAALMKIKSEADSYADFKNHVNAHDIHGRTPGRIVSKPKSLQYINAFQ